MRLISGRRAPQLPSPSHMFRTRGKYLLIVLWVNSIKPESINPITPFTCSKQHLKELDSTNLRPASQLSTHTAAAAASRHATTQARFPARQKQTTALRRTPALPDVYQGGRRQWRRVDCGAAAGSSGDDSSSHATIITSFCAGRRRAVSTGGGSGERR